MKAQEIYEFEPFRLNASARVLLRDGAVVPLAPKALEILAALVRSGGELVLKEELMKAGWPDAYVEEGSLAQIISLLRKALGPAGDGKPYIETMAKRGYRFAAPVRRAEGDRGDTAGKRPRRRRLVAWMAAAPALAVFAGLAIYLSRTTGHGPIRSLVVLPLVNQSGDPGQEYFADGLTEVLTGELARIRTLRVVSRTSAMHYKKTTKLAPEIARELNVDALMEGSVVRTGDRVSIRVQLIRAATDEHVWAESYERQVGDVPRLQSGMALAIATEIQARVSPEERMRYSGARRVRQEAFEEYLRGRQAWNQRTAKSIQEAIVRFRAAIESDAQYAPAYAGLADCYNQLGTVIIGERPPSEVRPLAEAAARKALELDGRLAEAQAALAYDDLYNWNWERAEAGFRKAIELNPSYASAHLWYSHFLAARGRAREAFAEVHAARDLDPLSPIIATQVGWIYHLTGRPQEAIAEYQKVLERHPDYLWAHWQLGHAYTDTGQRAAAVAELEKACSLSGRNPAVVGSLARAYGKTGERAKALKLVAELTEMARHRYVTPAAFEAAYMGLGDLDRQFEYLEKSYQERSNSLAYFAVAAGRERLLADARGQAMLRRLGLAR